MKLNLEENRYVGWLYRVEEEEEVPTTCQKRNAELHQFPFGSINCNWRHPLMMALTRLC